MTASLRVLEEIGMDFLLPEARERLKAAGAEVEGERVRLPRQMVEAALATVPSRFTFHARNPENSIEVGGNAMFFGPVSSAPNCSDLDGGRRPGTLADYRSFLQAVPDLQLHPASSAAIRSSPSTSTPRSAISMRSGMPPPSRTSPSMPIRWARSASAMAWRSPASPAASTAKRFEREPSLFTIVNTNSPLKLDNPMLQGIIEMSAANQIVCVTPFTLAGAMAPVTVAGALVQQNAEALAGLVMTQTVRAGAPFIYGGFTSNVDMKSGAPAFGTPEYMKAAIVGGQLARRYNLPYRTSNTCAANAVDAQAAYKSVFSLWGVTMGGGDVGDARGGLEDGRRARCLVREKFVLDCDLIQMVMEFLTPLDTGTDALGIDAMRKIRYGGHFFGCACALARYSNAFSTPLISDWRNFQQWQAAGSPEAQHKANRLWKEALKSSMRSRRWMRPLPRNSTPSLPAASKKAAPRPISEAADFSSACVSRTPASYKARVKAIRPGARGSDPSVLRLTLSSIIPNCATGSSIPRSRSFAPSGSRTGWRRCRPAACRPAGGIPTVCARPRGPAPSKATGTAISGSSAMAR